MRKETKRIVLFDTETSGLNKASVLQFSAIILELTKFDLGNRLFGEKIEYDFNVIKRINRFYYSENGIEDSAYIVHHIDENVISSNRRRDKATYPRLFKDDKYVHSIFNDKDFYVAHNINFDKQFIKNDLALNKCVDTMILNKCVLKLFNNFGGFKNPKLMECVEFYGIDYNEEDLHDSAVDIDLTLKVFEKMFYYDGTTYDINKLIFPNFDTIEDERHTILQDLDKLSGMDKISISSPKEESIFDNSKLYDMFDIKFTKSKTATMAHYGSFKISLSGVFDGLIFNVKKKPSVWGNMDVFVIEGVCKSNDYISNQTYGEYEKHINIHSDFEKYLIEKYLEI